MTGKGELPASVGIGPLRVMFSLPVVPMIVGALVGLAFLFFVHFTNPKVEVPLSPPYTGIPTAPSPTVSPS